MMKDKTITIKPKGISQKQWAILLLELNLLKKAWRPYGVSMEVSAPGSKRIIEWGTKPYAETNRRSSKQLGKDERSEV